MTDPDTIPHADWCHDTDEMEHCCPCSCEYHRRVVAARLDANRAAFDEEIREAHTIARRRESQ